MNKIIVEVSIGELLDKISILEIKQEKIKDKDKLKFISDEHAVLKDQLEKNVKSSDQLEKLFKSLKEINTKLWAIEDDKRLCEKEKDFTEKFADESKSVITFTEEHETIIREKNNNDNNLFIFNKLQ